MGQPRSKQAEGHGREASRGKPRSADSIQNIRDIGNAGRQFMEQNGEMIERFAART
jgi:hypothetical protein